MEVVVDFQNLIENSDVFVPDEVVINHWVSSTCAGLNDDVEMTVRITDEDEMFSLNSNYRGKNYATNVLSFPADLPDEIDLPLLGDIVICAAVVNREAIEQEKAAEAHWAHMLVHGTLHLLGYDHIDDAEADEMEAKEIVILQHLGYRNPYLLTEKE